MTAIALSEHRKAVVLHPAAAAGYLGAAAALRDLGDRDLSLVSYDRALAIEPGNIQALCNKGVVLLELGRAISALGCYDAALAIEADHVGALLNRVVALSELGRLSEARRTCRRILAALPAQVDALNELGLALKRTGASATALASFDRALAIWPGSADVLCNRGVALEDLKRDEAALASYDRAIGFEARHLQALSNRIIVLQRLGRFDEALQDSDRVLDIDPHQVAALMGRGNALAAMARHGQAASSFARAIALVPDHAACLRNRGNSLLFQGQVSGALVSLRRAQAASPDDADIHSNIVFALDFSLDAGFEEQQAARRRWFEVFRRGLPTTLAGHANDRDPTRRLRLGYVSADFKRHSAAFIFGPIIARHDRSAFEITCYSNVPHPDGRTHEFERMADRWRVVSHLADDEVAAAVRADSIDILIDLSGHSAGHRLGVFGRKPAPVQVTAWGLGTGNGMPMVDYLFSDAVSIPQEVRHLFAETVIDLPLSMTFEAPAYAPAVAPLPALSKGHVTFGCFNRLAKVSKPAMRVWAEVLTSVPGSRLILKDPPLDDPSVRAGLAEAFASLRVDPARIDMRGRTPHAEHLALFGEVDIALDPFPQNGGISSWEALWMGCPTIAKLGTTIGSRATAAILTSVGLHDWIAADDAAYVALAVRRAGDLGTLSRIRETLRRAVTESDAGNPDRYTRRAEAAYRRMWEKWCASGR